MIYCVYCNGASASARSITRYLLCHCLLSSAASASSASSDATSASARATIIIATPFLSSASALVGCKWLSFIGNGCPIFCWLGRPGGFLIAFPARFGTSASTGTSISTGTYISARSRRSPVLPTRLADQFAPLYASDIRSLKLVLVGRVHNFRKFKFNIFSQYQITVLVLRHLDCGVMHEHVAVLVVAFKRGDEPKPGLVVEPFHTAGESVVVVDAAAAAAAAADLVGYTHCCFVSD